MPNEKATRRAPHTSAIVHFLEFDVAQRKTCLDRIDLVTSTGRGQTQPLAVEEGNHVLSSDTLLGLPTNMQSTAELDVTESADSVLGHRVELLFLLVGLPPSQQEQDLVPGWETQVDPGGSMSFPAPT